MARRRKRKAPPPIHLSSGPLPPRLAERYAGHYWVFCDASQKQRGGLAVLLFHDEFSAPLAFSRTVPATGSNELELAAALFALAESLRHYPDQPVVLFSDNLVAMQRLDRASMPDGLARDHKLVELLVQWEIETLPAKTRYQWIPGHATCRGNVMADELARQAAAG